VGLETPEMSENNIPHVVDQGASVMPHEHMKPKKTYAKWYILAGLIGLALGSVAAFAQQVPRVAVVPGSNNAYAAGFSGNRNLGPAFSTELPTINRGNAFDLYDRNNPDVLVGPMPGLGALLAPVTPYLNESFYHGRAR
jgi:hypothetical protein